VSGVPTTRGGDLPRHEPGHDPRHEEVAGGGRPIGEQLSRRVLVPLLIGVLLFVTPAVILTVRDARSQLTQQAELRAATLALLARDVLGTGADTALAELPLLEGEQVAIVVGGVQVSGSAALPESVLSGPAVRSALTGTIRSEVVGDLDVAVGAAPVVQGARVVGAAVTTLPSDAADTRVRNTLLLLGLLSGGLLLLAGASSRSFARTIVRPVARLDEVAGQLATGDLDARAPTDLGPPELRRLAVTLNASADRLQGLLAQQRRFVGDASHQLRTPLTGLRLRLETAEAAAGAGPAGDRLRAAIAEVDRLTDLVGDLLVLARAEEDRPAAVAVDLGDVVEDRVATWHLVGQDQGVTVSSVPATTPIPPVRAVPGALEQVLDNLLENALRVAPAGTSVAVHLDVESDPDDAPEVVCRVTDRGPGLAPEQRERAFDRFWRAPGSATDGSGLGLAIVRELVTACGGTIRLREHAGGGLVAELRLPPDR
jgi:signal transduction histidine kinase